VKKKKILIIIYSLKFGGAERQVVEDANALINKNYKVSVAFHENGNIRCLFDSEVKLYRLWSQFSSLSSIQLFFHLIFYRYNIIHSHMLWAAKASFLPGLITRHKVVINEHGLGIWRKWYHKLSIKLISCFSKRIINSCEATRKIRLENENISIDKLVTIYNSFSLNRKNDISNLPESLKSSGQFIIGFVGRFDVLKRLEVFLLLAEYLKENIPKLKIVLIGDGDIREDYEKEIDRRNLRKYFYLTGYILNPGPYYQAFNIFLLPSKREAFSVALLEASSHGTLSIAFDVGGNAEIIKDQITGYLIPDNDIDLMVKRILFLYHNPRKIKKMGEAAKKFVENNFSIERRVKQLENLYLELL